MDVAGGKFKVLQNDANGVVAKLTELLSNIFVTTSSNYIGSLLNEILGEDLLVPMSQPMPDEFKLSIGSIHTPT
eukprot:4167200-Ditylum_brightwellii.AAC.1